MAQIKLFAPNFSTNRFVGLKQITYALQYRHPTANLFSQSDIKISKRKSSSFVVSCRGRSISDMFNKIN